MSKRKRDQIEILPSDSGLHVRATNCPKISGLHSSGTLTIDVINDHRVERLNINRLHAGKSLTIGGYPTIVVRDSTIRGKLILGDDVEELFIDEGTFEQVENKIRASPETEIFVIRKIVLSQVMN